MSISAGISVVVTAYDEEQMLGGCLELLDFADEIVVVIDDRTTDTTRKIARRFTSKVFTRRLDTFAAQKNFAINKTVNEWILVVDADERITPALSQEITTTLGGDPAEVGFQIRFVNFFFGRRMRHGGWNENHIRLVRKSHARYAGDIHEQFDPKGPVGQLRQPIWHFTHRRIENMMTKTINYGRVQAAEMQRQGHPPVTKRSFFAVPIKECWFRLVRKRGYRDGIEGIIESIYQGFSLFVVYVMLWQLQRGKRIESSYERLEREVKQVK